MFLTRPPLSLGRLGAILALCALAGCSLPRSAALHATIVREASAPAPGFALVEVTRDSLPMIAAWPGPAPARWLTGAGGSAQSVVRPGDRLDLRIWDSQDNSLLISPGQRVSDIMALEVARDGTVHLPYVGDVAVAGLGPTAARARLQSRMATIAPSAQVQLSLVQGRSSAVEVVGGVARPGAFPLHSDSYRVLSALADAGGIPVTLRNPQLRLMRGGDSYRIPVARLYGDSRLNSALRPRDTLIVEEDQRSFTALGAAGDQSLVYFPKQQLSALEAVALMDGLNAVRADPKGVLVLRDYPAASLRSDGAGPLATQTVFSFDLSGAEGMFAARHFGIHEGDTVLATESPVRSVQTVFGLIGSAIGISGQVGVVTN